MPGAFLIVPGTTSGGGRNEVVGGVNPLSRKIIKKAPISIVSIIGDNGIIVSSSVIAIATAMAIAIIFVGTTL